MTCSLVERGKESSREVDIRGAEGLMVMLLQVCRDYPGLPPIWEMDVREIRIFYDGLRFELMGSQRGG